jgi:phage terminase large subunit-like protein
VRFTLIEGATGILSPADCDEETGVPHGVGFPEFLIDDYNATYHRVTLWNGAVIRGFGSERPNKLRGPQHHRVWADEIAAWENAVETYNMMRFGLRLGRNPQFLWTSTPKPNKIIKKLVAASKKGTAVVVVGTSYENKSNLSEVFWEEISEYAGTKLGRQELDGELLNEEEDGIIESKWIQRWPHDKPLPKFVCIIASLDTAFTAKNVDKKTHQADQSVMQVWGVFVMPGTKEFHVLLLDAWRDWLKFPDLVSTVQKDLKKTYGDAGEPLYRPFIPMPPDAINPTPLTAGHQGKPVDIIIIEDKGSGISLRQQLAFENVLAHPYNPGRADKLLRLHLVSPVFAAKRVWMVASGKLETYVPNQPPPVRAWAEPVREALCTFRGEGSIEYDDDVDAATQALKYIKDRFMRSLTQKDGSHQKDEDNTRKPKSETIRVNPYAE